MDEFPAMEKKPTVCIKKKKKLSEISETWNYGNLHQALHDHTNSGYPEPFLRSQERYSKDIFFLCM